MYAKNILPDRFWLLKNNFGDKLGTMQVENKKIKIFLNGEEQTFDSIDQAFVELSIEIEDSVSKNNQQTEWFTNEYPTNVQPYNELYDAKSKLPIYTKKPNSKSYHAAGYYIIKFESAWAQAFCPKVTTLKSNQYAGPYKTKLEMQEQLRKHNAKIKNCRNK